MTNQLRLRIGRAVATLIRLAVIIVIVLAPGILSSGHAGELTLAGIQSQVVRNYRDVHQMEAGELAELLRKKAEDILLLDVREPDEYGVSHLANAKRVDPGIWRSSFMQRYAKAAKGRTVVFYCSVGVRSSKLAAYVGDALRKSGAKAIYNLKGGVFNWHNRKLPLMNAKGPTPYVHPYDQYWGKLVERRKLTRYKP